MVFPTTKLLVKVELQLAETWTDVTAYTYLRDGIGITRGRRDEGGSFEPGECQLTLNNRDGRFSPRNPTGPYYGQLTRNTPVRVSVVAGSVRLVLPSSTDECTAPDTASLSITGDIDLRVEANVVNWAASGSTNLINKSLTAGQRSYRMGVFSGGLIFIDWSADGTAELFLNSTVPVPQTNGHQAIRATLDVDNGAAGRTATFYTAPTIAGPWVQLGAAATAAGTTSIFNSTSAVAVRGGGPAQVYAASIRSSIGGTEVGNPNFTAQAEGATSFADAAGNTWTNSASALLTARSYRFYGEVSSWPQAWDISERDVFVPVGTAGILRRLGQGTAALKTTIQRYTLSSGAVTARAYWPMEDGSEATTIASGLAGGSSMRIEGSPRLATSEVFPASNPLPEMALGQFSGPVEAYTSTNIINAQMLLAVPAAGDTTDAIILRLFTSGTASRWDLVYTTTSSGQLTLNAYDAAGASLLSAGVGSSTNGQPAVLTVQLVQNGANIDYSVILNGYFAGNTYGGPASGTLNTRTVGQATYVQINQNAALDGTTVGHLVITAALPPNATIVQVLRGYVGELAGRRIERLCSEESVTFAALGNLDDTVAVGVQHPAQLLDLLAECEAADLGQLYESRDQLGLNYRTRSSRAVQNSPFALTYAALGELQPVEDDQNTRNDVTVSRVDGASARSTVDTGALSTLAPPSGVGRYDDSVSLSLGADTQCAGQANLRVMIGTVDEPRYPLIHVELGSARIGGVAATLDGALAVDHGDRITVTGTPVWLPPGTIDQHTIGQTETLGVREYEIDFVCQPANPIGGGDLYDATTFRWAADGSTLSAGITSTATGAAALSLVTTTGPVWTSAAGDFPLDILVGGEQITLSAIAATASPQSATVSARSVNGVVKAHLAGEVVQIADPTYYQL